MKGILKSSDNYPAENNKEGTKKHVILNRKRKERSLERNNRSKHIQ